MKFLPSLIFFVVVAFATANFHRFGLDSDEELNDSIDNVDLMNHYRYDSDFDVHEIDAEVAVAAFNKTYKLGSRKTGNN